MRVPCLRHRRLEVRDVVVANRVEHLGDRRGSRVACRLIRREVLVLGGAERDLLPAAVVAADRLDDLVPARDRACPADGDHDGLVTRVREAHLGDRRHALGDPLCQLGLGYERRGMRRAGRAIADARRLRDRRGRGCVSCSSRGGRCTRCRRRPTASSPGRARSQSDTARRRWSYACCLPA